MSTGLPRRRSPPKIATRWSYRLPIKNLTAHYNSQLGFGHFPGSNVYFESQFILRILLITILNSHIIKYKNFTFQFDTSLQKELMEEDTTQRKLFGFGWHIQAKYTIKHVLTQKTAYFTLKIKSGNVIYFY